HVFDFADAVCVFALAQAGAAEVEAQHGESEVVERLHGVEDDFIVQRSTVERMRMTDDGSMRRVGRSGVEQGFQASGGAGEEERANARSFGEHGIRVQQLQWSDGRSIAPSLHRQSVTLSLHGPVRAYPPADRY